MVNGLGNLDIHNDAACHKIKDEITLMPLFCAINALTTNKLRDEAYDNVLTGAHVKYRKIRLNKFFHHYVVFTRFHNVKLLAHIIDRHV